MNNVNDMVDLIRNTTGAAQFVAGVMLTVEETAVEWCQNDFGADAADWWAAGCFDADRAAILRDAGITPEQAAIECPQLEVFSWGYAHSNGDVCLDDVLINTIGESNGRS